MLTIPAALLSTIGALVSVRQRKPVALLTVAGTICMAATVGIWARFNEPVNQQVVAWADSGELPDNWRSQRDQWEHAHAMSAVLHAASFSADHRNVPRW